ncbi:MAG: serine hydrolase [Planctomycetota bacterium]|nr:serine hydrolase [Planctomycetota bacterium]
MTLLFLLFLAAIPQSDADRLTAAFEAARESVVAATAQDPAPAIGLAVRVGSEERAWAWGWADVEERRAATPETRFRLASVSKSFTGVTAALLWEEGVLDLDAPIQQYLPDFPRHEEGEITARLLGGHLSGIPHYGADDHFEPGTYHCVKDGLRVFAHRPLAHAPGSKYMYSSYGFNLLGATVEAASGTEFRELLRARLFDPLGMDGVIAEHPDTDLGEVASLYRNLLGEVVELPRDEVSYKWPGGGFVAKPRDMVRYARAFDEDGPVLTPKTRALMRTSQKTPDGRETSYSLGLNVGEHFGHFAFAHGGSQTGAKSYFVIFPEQRVAVAICANHSNSGVGDGKAVWRAAGILLEALVDQAAGGSPAKQ